MARKKEIESRNVSKAIGKAKSIDLRSIYAFDPKDITPDISATRYSNLAYIQVMHRDLFIDFLEMPGVRKDGKMVVNGTRIFMSHAAGQKLAEVLAGILNQVSKSGDMEKYDVKTKQ